jgi:hypothetical protein
MTHHSSFQNKVLRIAFDFCINEFRGEVFCGYHPYEPGSSVSYFSRVMYVLIVSFVMGSFVSQFIIRYYWNESSSQ